MEFSGTSDYVSTLDLTVAVNASINLERPLLVKGEPGTGKTELARQVANSLKLEIIEWNIKSTTKAQQVYEANQDITSKYRYTATLDSRTSPICRALDGQEFEYGKGPTPPQHFNCRSTTVPVIDYEALGFTPPKPGKRAAQGGMVPDDQSYGQWLSNQSKEVKADVLGPEKVPYFNRLARKYGPTDAIRKFVSQDGSELTLDQLRRRYPNDSSG